MTSPTYTCTRRLEFDAAHRVERHAGKCSSLHGHRYVIEVTCAAPELTREGFVVDFGVIKSIFGRWIDDNLDHTTLYDGADRTMAALAEQAAAAGWRPWYNVGAPPTSEALAEHLFGVASRLLSEHAGVVRVRVYETPNCWSDYPRAP